MKAKKAILMLALALAALSGALAQPTQNQLRLLDSVLIQLHQQAMFNGVVLLADHGKVVYKKALGTANIATNEPLQTTSAFNLASVSKQFVGMMVMMLQEQGKLGYDDPVQKHLPGFPYPGISIRQLLTHTSGLPEYFDLAFAQQTVLDTLTNASLLQLLAEQKPPLKFSPGERWEYCNTGYVLLASIIEAAAGMPIEAFFKQQITGPLGLNDTYIYTLKMPTFPANRVYGFKRDHGKAVLNDLMRFDGVVGDGNIYASAEDLLRWEQALYTDKLVRAQTLKEAFTPVRLNDGKTHPYGFGWAIDSTGKVHSHTGSWVGFFNLIRRDTERKQTLIVLSSGTDAEARTQINAVLLGKKPVLPSLELIANVNLIDGTGIPARHCSVRLRDQRIWEIGDLQPFPGESVTDGRGLTLAPGFIDSHSHHFGGLTENPDGEALSSQGVTTIVIGQDGSSYLMDTLEAYFQKQAMAINVANYAGHSTLREMAMGTQNLYRTATKAEVERMKALLRTEMEKGALGLSTGLEYEEAFYSNREEVIELAKVTAAAKGRYISHIRSEDIRMEEAIDEIIAIGREAKLPVQISHLKMAKRDQWGQAPQLLAIFERARAEGIDITADCYPYDFWRSTIRVLFPNKDFSNLASAQFAVDQLFDPEKSILVNFAPEPAYAGKSVSAIAALRKESPAKTLMYLVAKAEEFEAKNPDFRGNVEGIMGKSMDEHDVELFLTWPNTNICSDGSWGGHPRGYGSFTRVLGHYVREKRIMPLETAIYKMTGLAAEHLGIADRGIVAPGYFADLVLFDPATVQDHATIKQPKAISSGIAKVWVNGKSIWSGQKPSGVRPGKLIKRP